MTMLSITSPNLVKEIGDLESQFRSRHSDQFAREHKTIGRLHAEINREYPLTMLATTVSVICLCAFAAFKLISSAFATFAGGLFCVGFLFSLYHGGNYLMASQRLNKLESDLRNNAEYQRLDISDRALLYTRFYFANREQCWPRSKQVLDELISVGISKDEKNFKIVPLSIDSSSEDVIQTCARLVMDNFRKTI